VDHQSLPALTNMSHLSSAFSGLSQAVPTYALALIVTGQPFHEGSRIREEFATPTCDGVPCFEGYTNWR